MRGLVKSIHSILWAASSVVERVTDNDEVVGPIPTPPTKDVRIGIYNWADSSTVDHPVCIRKVWGSNPHRSTIQNFSTFSLGTSRNARRAERRGSQGIEPKNPTAQKTKRKRICPKVDGSFQLSGQMP